MNWIKLLIFIVFILYFYHLLGTGIHEIFRLKNPTFAKTILCGFLTLTSIQWLIGFPAQVLHISWNLYFVVLLSIYSFLFLFLMKHFGFRKTPKSVLVHKIQEFIKHYWFVIFLTLSFAFWSMSSQLPYLLMNYDDHYYIGAIVQQVGSEALATENYFNGTPMVLGLARLINTFEINYGFWSSLFQINPAFFARGVMVIHNYFIIFIALITLCESFSLIKPVYKQFVLVPFTIFLLPAIYLEQNLSIFLYDGWQMNTAVWYGGSLVRIISLPVSFMYLREVLDDFNWKKIFYAMIPFFAFISLSSIFVPIAIVSIGMWILYALWMWYDNRKNRTNLIILFAVLITLLIGLKVGPKLLEIIKPSLTNFYENSGSIWIQVDKYSDSNYIFVILSASMLLFTKKWRNEPFYKEALIQCAVCVLLYTGFFNKFFITICTGLDFVVYRFVTSLQISLLMLCSILALWSVSIYVSKKICGVVALLFTVTMHGINIHNMEIYKDPNTAGLGTGLSIYGYSPMRLLRNQYMTPGFYIDFKEYFDSLEASRYRIISPQIIPYEEGTHYLGISLASISKNVESCVSHENVRCNVESIDKLVKFAEGSVSYEDVREDIEANQISYVITVNTAVKDDLLNRGMELVVESLSLMNERIYLLKLK